MHGCVRDDGGVVITDGCRTCGVCVSGIGVAVVYGVVDIGVCGIVVFYIIVSRVVVGVVVFVCVCEHGVADGVGWVGVDVLRHAVYVSGAVRVIALIVPGVRVCVVVGVVYVADVGVVFVGVIACCDHILNVAGACDSVGVGVGCVVVVVVSIVC